MKKYLSAKENVAFALSAFNSYMIVALTSTYMIFFYTDILLLSSGFIFVLMAVARIWDTINDPLMGLIIDKSRLKGGRMLPYLKSGAIPMGISVVIMFLPIEGPGWLKMAFASATYIIYGMLYTYVDIPFWGLLSISTPNGHERAGLLSRSATIGAIGCLVPMALMPIISAILPGKWTYFTLAIMVGIFSIITMTNLSKKGIERIAPPKENISFKQNIKVVVRNRPMIMTILASILACTRYLMQLAAIYVATYVIHIDGISPEAMLFIIYIIVGAGMLVGMLITPIAFRKFGYKAVFITSGIFSSITLAAAYFVGYQNLVPAFILIALGGIGLGVYNVITYPMVGDSLDYLEWKSNCRMEGFSFSLQSFMSKFNQAFAAIAVTISLGLFKYIAPVVPNTPLPQSPETINGIFSLVTLIPAIGFALSIIPMLFYNFSGKNRKIILKELSEQRERNAINLES